MFKNTADKNVNILKPKLTVDVTGATEIKLKEDNDFLISYQNLETSALNGLFLKANVPNDFILTAADPAIKEQKKYDSFSELFWDLGDLASGETGQVSLQGYFEGANNVSSDNDVIYGEIYSESDNLNKVILSADSLPLNIQSGKLILTLKVNDSLNQRHLDNQNELHYSLYYKNISDETLENVSIDLMVDDFVSKDPLLHILNWNTAEDDYDGSVARSSGGAKVNWDINNIAELDELSPGEEGTINFSINKYANSKFDGIADWRNFVINNYFVLSYQSAVSDAKLTAKSNVVYLDYKQLLNLQLEEFEKLGAGSDGNNLYKMIYTVALGDDSEDYYNLLFTFKPAADNEWVDLYGKEDSESTASDLAYIQYYDQVNDAVNVKFADIKKCDGTCTFSVLMKTADSCETAECLFDDYYGEAWLNNEIMEYNP